MTSGFFKICWPCSVLNCKAEIVKAKLNQTFLTEFKHDTTAWKEHHKNIGIRNETIPCWYTLFWPCSLLFLAALTLGILLSNKEHRIKIKSSYCITFHPPCAIYCFWLERLGRMFKTADQTVFKYGGQLELNMHYKKWIEKWRSYRYRFVPWIALNLRKRLDDPLFVYSFNKPALSLQYDIYFARSVSARSAGARVFETS